MRCSGLEGGGGGGGLGGGEGRGGRKESETGVWNRKGEGDLQNGVEKSRKGVGGGGGGGGHRNAENKK